MRSRITPKLIIRGDGQPLSCPSGESSQPGRITEMEALELNDR
jgi:hypothetical protein